MRILQFDPWNARVLGVKQLISKSYEASPYVVEQNLDSPTNKKDFRLATNFRISLGRSMLVVFI